MPEAPAEPREFTLEEIAQIQDPGVLRTLARETLVQLQEIQRVHRTAHEPEEVLAASNLLRELSQRSEAISTRTHQLKSPRDSYPDVSAATDPKNLQALAKENTTQLRHLRHQADATEDVEEKRRLEQLISARRKRGTALIARRNVLLQQEVKDKEVQERQARLEQIQGLRLPLLQRRRKALEEELLEFIQDLEVAKRRASGPDQRDDARRLMGMLRGINTAFEAVRRAPSLMEGPETSYASQ